MPGTPWSSMVEPWFTCITWLSAAGPRRTLPGLTGEKMWTPGLIYFRCTPRFSTAAPEWAWLNHTIAVGTGRRRPDAVEIDVFTVG